MFLSQDLFRRIAVAVALMLGPGLLPAFGTIGHTAGQGSVTNTGSANYSIPLQVAPGPLGLQPKLSLDYSHGGGNGPLGVGWRIGGLSTITRVPSTIEQDGFARGVTLTSADALALDGRRLMKSGGYYYTEVDTLTRVEASGTGYVARFASGEVYTYSPVYAGSSALAWVVTRIEDRGGNAITINYVTESGVAVVSSITYPNGSISFSYESRTDKPVSYICGHAVQLTKRVSLIIVSSSTESMYSMTPSYSYSPQSGRSVLTSLRDSRLDGSTSLVWPSTSTGGSFPSSPPGGWTSQSGYAPQEDIAWGNQGSDGGIRYVDLDGDGYTDYVYSRSGVRKAYLNNRNGGWNSSSSYALPVDLYYEKPSLPFSCWTERPGIYLGAQLVDLTGDGRVDILYGRAGDRRAYINTGSGWSRNDSYAPRHDLVDIARDEESAVRIVDVNGDGLPDYIRGYSIYAKTFSEQPVVYLNNGSGWSPSSSSSYLPKIPLVYFAYSKQRDNGVRFVDVNGDGLVDQLIGVNYNGTLQLEAYLNTGSGFSGSSTSTYAPPKPFIRNSSGAGYADGGVQLVDLNSDGLLDMVVGFKSYWGGWFPGDYRTAYLNTGGGWSESSGYAPKDDLSYCDYNGETCDGGVRFEDVNGDGLPDYLVAMSSRLGSRRATYINTGSGWASSPASNYASPYDFVGTWSSTDGIDMGVRFGDFNGDGRADIAKGFESTRTAYLNTAPPPELLKSVTDEFGLKREFEYQLLTNDDYHARATNSVAFPIVNYCAPMWIATAFSESNGIGGTHRTEYTYAYARVHVQGRGFLGFEIFESYDNTTGYSTAENVSQAFPWIGLVESRSITGGGLNRSVANTLRARSTHTKVSFPYVGRSVVSDSRDGTTLTTADTYDDYGNLTQRIADYPGCPSVTTVNTFDNFTGNWVLGLLRTQTVTSDGQTTQTTRDYYSSGLLKTETEGVANPLTTAYARNGNGLVTSVTRSGAGMAARSETYSSFGVHGLPQTVTNAAGHVATLAYDSRFGTVTSQTDPNGLVTTGSFDALGRPTAEARPDGSNSTTTYSSASNYGAKIVATTTRNSAPDESVYTDMLDRVVARTQVGGAGQTLLAQTTYRSDGLVSSKRALGLTGSDQYSYDGQQRVTSLTHANGLVTSYSYSASGGGQGMTTSITEAGQTRTEKRNARGQVTTVTTPESATLVTSYNGLGHVTQTNASGAIATYTRDDRGLITAQSDPDLGSWSYTNDATGQVVSQTDARGNVTTVTYDGLGRMTARTIAGETSTWAYDGTASGNKLGRLRSVTGPGGFRRALYYDSQARPVLEVAQIRGQFFNIATAYGNYSRVDRVEYRWRPLGLEGADFFGNAKWHSFGAAYEYNADGFVTAVRDTSGRAWWTSPTYNDLGKVTAFTYGNGLATACEFDGNTGAMKSTQSSVQHLSFQYDLLGNLTRREDHLANSVNTYGYDGLNRLTSITGSGAATMGYDAQGNLTSRNGVTYSYTGGDSGGPHALKSAGGTAYHYDACGNVTYRGSDSIQWTAFNRPARMTTGNVTTDFAYDGDLGRVAEIGSDGVVKVFVAPGFEQYQRNGETETRIYLSAPSGTVGLRGFVEKAVPTIRPGGIVEAGHETIQYYHADHLGSVLQTTGAGGATAERYSFDSWGSRTTQAAAGDGALPADRGFTGHEELSAHRLVHMNARIYESGIGRMLSPDTIIQAPLNPQNYNRYTYVANNPLSLTDPSGHAYGDPDQIAPDATGKRGGAIVGKPTISADPIQSQSITGGVSVPGSTPTNSGSDTDIGPTRDSLRSISKQLMRERHAIDVKYTNTNEYQTYVYLTGDGEVTYLEWQEGNINNAGAPLKKLLSLLPDGAIVLSHIHTHGLFYKAQDALGNISFLTADEAPSDLRRSLNNFSGYDPGDAACMRDIDSDMTGKAGNGKLSVAGHQRAQAGFPENWVRASDGRWFRFRRDFEMYVVTQDGTMLLMGRDQIPSYMP